MAFELFALTGKRALITGSSQGIGFALAQGLAEHGAEIVLNGRDAGKLDAAAAKLAAAGHKVSVAGFDVTQAQAAKDGVEAIEKNSGAIDILINNAGMQFRSPLEDFPVEKWEQLLATNVSSAFYIGQTVARHMIRRGHGKIINIASVQSELARPGIAPYTATKGAVKNLTRGMCADWAKYGLQINAIAPGYFKTRSIRRWSTIRNSRAGSKSGHRPPVGEMSMSWSGPPCFCPPRLRPSSTDIRSTSTVGSPPVSRFAPLQDLVELREINRRPITSGVSGVQQ